MLVIFMLKILNDVRGFPTLFNCLRYSNLSDATLTNKIINLSFDLECRPPLVCLGYKPKFTYNTRSN